MGCLKLLLEEQMYRALPALFVLAGCGIDSMAGDWKGELTCSDNAEVELSIEIDDSEGELDYIGDFYLQASNFYTHSDGVEYFLESDWAGTLTAAQELPDGEQDVSFVLSERAPICRILKEGNLVGEDCYEDGLPIGYTFDGNFEASWDGLDEFQDMANLYCEGDLTRR